jgi:hypothetical protein
MSEVFLGFALVLLVTLGALGLSRVFSNIWKDSVRAAAKKSSVRAAAGKGSVRTEREIASNSLGKVLMVISFGIFVGIAPLGIGDSIIGFFLAGIFAFSRSNTKKPPSSKDSESE